MKISYLVTCHNETSSLRKCIDVLQGYRGLESEIVILDDFSDNIETAEILDSTHLFKPDVRVVKHALDKNYGAHKNFGNEQCTGDWVFQIDGDEIPTPTLIANIKNIITENPNVELIFVPRINDFIGVTDIHARKWGWRLTPCDDIIHEKIIDTNSEEYKFLKNNDYIVEETKNVVMVKIKHKAVIVNAPDYQGRIYKRIPERIRWDRRLHEKIEGYTSMATLPDDTDLALYHDKTIDTQEKTNIRYNTWFTEEENKGHNVFDKKK